MAENQVTAESYQQHKVRLMQEMHSAAAGEGIALDKKTSNLFRHYGPQAQKKLNVRDFNHVLKVNKEEGWIEVEGMTQYYDLVKEALKYDVMPTVVPQLRSITIGGATSGVGIEATSFKYGLVHETILEMEILLSSGQVITATPTNEHKDIFFGMPNSYGTLGYILKLKVKAIPVKKYVHVTHIRYNSYAALVEGIKLHAQDTSIDFIDGVVFSSQEMYLSIGKFTDEAPYTSDYTYNNIYYRSIKKNTEDYLTTHDYIWRWDTDWFWCSKNLYMQNPLIRRIVGKERLNSIFYTKIMRWNAKWKVSGKIEKLLGRHSESVIQDVDIPIDNVEEYLNFFAKEIGITPVWICPIKRYDANANFSLFPMEENKLHVNVGFWDVVPLAEAKPEGYLNKKVEDKVGELHGIKSLYSSVFYDAQTFWGIYNKEVYDALKQKYDPTKKLPNLHDAVVKKPIKR
ncbi:MAG: FAD-binding oxidoreductase [Candidatus Andersenbacteria bacterium]|nr:FAD-binding oxidoreductase [Candidatus Andersenbacteria bacterium]